MTAATMDAPRRSAYPPDVDEIIEQVRDRVAAGERVPGLKAMRKLYRIGDDKARQVREAIRAEVDAGLLGRGTRRPLHIVEAGEPSPYPARTSPVPEVHAGTGDQEAREVGEVGVPTHTVTSAASPTTDDPPQPPEVPDEVPWEEWGGSFLVTARGDGEHDQDVAVDGQVRAAWRSSRQRAGLAEAARYDREATAADTIADRQATDRVWAAKATSDADRLTSPAARMVFLAKARRAVYGIFLALIVGGTVWGSVNARATLLPTVHDPSTLVSTALFGVDPLVSGLLIALLIVRAALSQRGEPPEMRGLVVVELALLGATLLLNAGPYLPGIGSWVGLLPAFAHALPALVVTATVAVFPQVDAAFAAMLRAARRELDR